jgi:hypothetical protein
LHADGDRVGLIAVLGRGVAEANVLTYVVGWERDSSVSGCAADDERAVRVHRRDSPELSVSYGLAVLSGELSVVATGGDDVADVGSFAVTDADAVGRVELAIADPSGLDGRVDGVDVVVRGCRDRDPVVTGRGVEPHGSDPLEVAFEGVRDDAVVGLVDLEGAGVAVAELE